LPPDDRVFPIFRTQSLTHVPRSPCYPFPSSPFLPHEPILCSEWERDQRCPQLHTLLAGVAATCAPPTVPIPIFVTEPSCTPPPRPHLYRLYVLWISLLRHHSLPPLRGEDEL
jgi:hypothetical protein